MAKSKNIGFTELHTQLQMLNALMTAQMAKPQERFQQQDLVGVLARTDASDQEIATILGTTPPTVAATKVRLKKKAKAQAASNGTTSEGN